MFAKKDFSFLLLVWRVLLYSRLAISLSSRLDCCKHILLIPGNILTPILEAQMFGSPLFPSVSLLLRLHLYLSYESLVHLHSQGLLWPLAPLLLPGSGTLPFLLPPKVPGCSSTPPPSAQA